MEIGRMQTLQVEKKVAFGVYLIDQEDTSKKDHVLLPQKQVPEGIGIGDAIRVFLYRDSQDRLISTTTEPLITRDDFGVLKVKEIGKIGAFLDWRLEKDLFLPFKEMTKRVKPEDEILVRCYVDKSGRLCGSMKGLYEMLSCQSPYQIGDEVSGRIYEFGHDFGTFVAIDDKYSAMVPRHEKLQNASIGDVLEFQVTSVKEDGKLDITCRQKAYLQMDVDAQHILELIDSYGGVLPFTEKATPEVILRETGLSKAAFKRAVGGLYKARKIDLSNGKIRKI